MNNEIIGHGNYKYKVHEGWASHNASTTPIKNCHELVMDSNGHLIMITGHTHNNILTFNRSGRILNIWGIIFPGELEPRKHADCVKHYYHPIKNLQNYV